MPALIFVMLAAMAAFTDINITSVGYPALPGIISHYNCEIVPCRLI